MIGIAVLGGGIFAREAHLPALKEVPEFSLKAVWSRSHSSASSAQKAAVDLSFPSSSEIQVYCETGGSSSGNLDALLAREDIKTVVLSLPIPSQPDIIRKCFKAGKNVISEKPVAKDVKHSLELIELWEKEYKPKGVQWIIAEQFPYEPAFVKAREVLETGAIGELRSFEMQWLNWMPQDGKYYLTEWRTKPEYQGGFILDGGVHFAAALRWMLGGLGYKIASLSATSSQQQEHLPPIDTVHSLVRLAPLSSGGNSTAATGSVVLSVGHERPDTPFYIYRGSKATLKIQLGAEIDSVANKKDKSWTVSLLGEKGEVLQKHGFDSIGVREEMKAFGKALDGLEKGDKQALELVMQKSGPRAALKDVDVIEGMLTSAEQEKWIKLQQ